MRKSTMFEGLQGKKINDKRKELRKELDVDAGFLCVMNLSRAFETYGKREDAHDSCILFEADSGKGETECSVVVKNTWHQKKSTHYGIKIKSMEGDVIFVGDPCYVIADWNRFLDDVVWSVGVENDGHFKQIPTGGDGSFETIVKRP